MVRPDFGEAAEEGSSHLEGAASPGGKSPESLPSRSPERGEPPSSGGEASGGKDPLPGRGKEAFRREKPLREGSTARAKGASRSGPFARIPRHSHRVRRQDGRPRWYSPPDPRSRTQEHRTVPRGNILPGGRWLRSLRTGCQERKRLMILKRFPEVIWCRMFGGRGPAEFSVDDLRAKGNPSGSALNSP